VAPREPGIGRFRDNAMKLRIGLIELGDAWQTRHRPALRMLHDRFDVRAVFSTVTKLAENSASEFQADAIDGYRMLVSRRDVDAVMILGRSWLGWLPMLAACEAGKAIYWAGDLDFDPHGDTDVRGAIEASGVAFMTEFPRRLAPATLRLKELIATQLGPPRLVFCHLRMQQSAVCSRAHDGDPARRELVELIDWCRYVVGCEPANVSSSGHCTESSQSAPGRTQSVDAKREALPTPLDYRSLTLQFDATDLLRPVIAQISCGSYIPPSWHEAVGFRPPSGMQIRCERGVAFIDLPANLVWFDDAGRHLESLETELPVGEQLLTQFHRSVTSLVRNMSDLDDAYRAATILAAAQQSDIEGRRIDL
jgi:predicted dehydrogenase